MTTVSYHYSLDGKTVLGPVSPSHLHELARTGILQGHHLIWKPGLPGWTAARSARGLFDGAAGAGSDGGDGAGVVGEDGAGLPIPEEAGFAAGESVGEGESVGVEEVAGAGEAERARDAGGEAVSESVKSEGGAVYRGAMEGVRYAGFWIRVLAWLIDAVILGVATGAMYAVMGRGFNPLWRISMFDSDVAGWVFSGVSLVMSWTYFAVMESSVHQGTVGKLVVGIYVVDRRGERLTLLHAVGRYAAKFLSELTLGIGYLLAAFTERKQGLHDMVASTYVLRA